MTERIMLPEMLTAGYDAVVILDTETTGISFQRDHIIELAALRLEGSGGTLTCSGEMDDLILLPPGKRVPPFIENLTGITNDRLAAEGRPAEESCRRFAGLLEGEQLLIAAYNAHFDLSFLFYFLRQFEQAALLRRARFLDLLTVYKDRRDYPHKLENAIADYGLEDQVQNSHRAVDDTWAAARVAEAMAREEDDLDRYVNLFGFNPKYGVEGRRISSVTYRPQPYGRTRRLYEPSALDKRQGL